MTQHRGILDLKFGELISIWDDKGIYNTTFVTSGFKHNIETASKLDITARDFLIAVIGSSEFSERQKISIHKIYLEYKEHIDIREYKDYIISNKDYLLQEKDIKASIELICLLELVNKYSDIGTRSCFRGNQTREMIYIETSIVNSMLKEEGKRIISKLSISVFKKDESEAIPEKLNLQFIKCFCESTDIEIASRIIFSLIAHGSKYNSLSNKVNYKDETYFLSSKVGQRKMAEEVIKKLSKAKELSASELQKHIIKCNKEGIVGQQQVLMRFLGGEYLTPAVQNISRNVSSEPIDLLDVYRSIDQVLEYTYKPDSVELAEEIVEVYQMANAAAGVTNLSVRVLKDVQNKNRLMKRAIYIAANCSKTKEELISKSISVFLQLAYIELVNKARNEKIDMILVEMENEIISNEQFKIIKDELESAKDMIKKQDIELARINAELKMKDTDALHIAYAKTIGDKDKEILMLQEKLSKLSSMLESVNQKNNRINEVEEVADIDISQLNILYIGNEESQKNIPELEKYVSKVKYINGEKRSSDITNIELMSIDIMLLQTEYVPHTTKKFRVAAKNNDIPVFTLDGTNIQLWIRDLKNKYQMYQNHKNDPLEN